MIATEHPDMTIYYYQIAKSILLAHNWDQEDLWEIKVGGGDVQPDPAYLPENLFIRVLSFGCEAEFQRLRLGEDKAWTLDGLYVDKRGSSSDVGGVKTLITIGEGDDE